MDAAELSRLIADPAPERGGERVGPEGMTFIPRPAWGPWMGVDPDAQDICAVVDCIERGRRQICLADGASHHHGCIHYDRLPEQAGLNFRRGWGWLCNTHYDMLKKAKVGPSYYEERAAR